MPKPVSDSLKFYPAYCFPVSPTFNAWAKLTANDIHGLSKKEGFEGTLLVQHIGIHHSIFKHLADGVVGQNIYFSLNHPIKWVRLVGVIVSYDQLPSRWIFILDDSSGATIEVTCPRNPTPLEREPSTIASNGIRESRPSRGSSTGTTVTGNAIDMTGIDLGCVVKIKGGINEFRGEKQITLERISMTSVPSLISCMKRLVFLNFSYEELCCYWLIHAFERYYRGYHRRGQSLERTVSLSQIHPF